MWLFFFVAADPLSYLSLLPPTTCHVHSAFTITSRTPEDRGGPAGCCCMVNFVPSTWWRTIFEDTLLTIKYRFYLVYTQAYLGLTSLFPWVIPTLWILTGRSYYAGLYDCPLPSPTETPPSIGSHQFPLLTPRINLSRPNKEAIRLVIILDNRISYLVVPNILERQMMSQWYGGGPNFMTNKSPNLFSENNKVNTAGDYDAKNYTQYEIDLTILIYELGGGGAVYALNHSIFALPCLSTIQPYRRQHKLVPCIDRLRLKDIAENISALFGPHEVRNGTKSGTLIESEPIICGHTLSFDEIAIERKIDYMAATDEMGGLCLEHVAALDTVKVVKAVREGKVHVAQEASVGAISRLFQTGYGAKPVFIAASCKKGNWKDCLRAMETVIEAWRRSPHGEIKHGKDVPRAINLILCNIEVGELDPDEFDPSEMAEYAALCLLGETFDPLIQPFINTELTLSEQIESLNGQSFLPNQLYGDLQSMVKVQYLWSLKLAVEDDVLEALFGRSRMIGSHSPNSSLGELRDRFNSAMNLDYIYEQHPELEQKPRQLSLFRMRDVDHLRPEHWKGELRADSCDLETCWKLAVRRTEAILRKYGVQMSVTFEELFKRKNTDLMRPFGGKYPAISAEVNRSIANVTANQTEPTAPAIDPNTITPASPDTPDFDAMTALEIAQGVAEAPAEPHSVFAAIDAEGYLAHKKTILQTFFDMTHDTHNSHDRLQRVRRFTIGDNAWTREDSENNEIVSPSTHFQLGNTFATLISYNGTHLGLALAKCTLIKRGPTGSKSASISAILRGELHLPASPYTISGQTWLFSDSDLPESWHRLWNRLLGDRTLHDKFPKFTGVCDGEFSYRISPWAESQGIIYSSPLANTVREEININRHACRICHKSVKDTDRQTHVGHHILKAMCGVVDNSAKFPVRTDT
ncbi:hypothetical protein C8R44DRAFT_750778 [Mycena epipterygia]|nr:hypothetical protein C8R44DRAFT_750778 [Mycena epipterygia]